jgi:hypothetical protein
VGYSCQHNSEGGQRRSGGQLLAYERSVGIWTIGNHAGVCIDAGSMLFLQVILAEVKEDGDRLQRSSLGGREGHFLKVGISPGG